MIHTITEIARRAKDVFSQEELDSLKHELAHDRRKGVARELEKAQRRLERERQERQRLGALYDFETQLVAKRGGGVAVGLDEVGRGPLAGPLAVGAVVLDRESGMIEGLNDSKRLSVARREEVASRISEVCIASAVVCVPPDRIDEVGIVVCLKEAFREAVARIEAQGIRVAHLLLDGNPLNMDPREVNVVKGDARCASIAAASILAKVDRDHLMDRLDEVYPGYGFSSNKGYGSESHLNAIRALGLSTVHRKTFCTNIH